jgi:hypothetical protein
MQEIDLFVWAIAGAGSIGALTCAAWAFHMQDNIWHERRKWAPSLGVASILLLIASVGLAAMLSRN